MQYFPKEKDLVVQETDYGRHAVTARQDIKLPRNLVVVLTLMLAAAFIMVLNETVMSVALPRLMLDFKVSAALVQWLTTAFLLTMAVVIPLTGYILQRFSTRVTFVTSVGLFTVGTGICAFAPELGVLIMGRVVQGAGTAIMLPLLTTTVLTLVPIRRRGRIMGLNTIIIAVAPAIGPVFSGLVLNTLGWRWTFLLILPVAVVIFILGAFLIVDFSDRNPGRLDFVSVVLSGAAFGGLIYGLSSIGESVEGHVLLPPWVPVSIGVVALALFVLRQLQLQGTKAVLLDMRPFRVGNFSTGTIMLMLFMAALFGSLILLPLYLQRVLTLDTLQTGLLLLPGGLTTGVVAPVVGRAFDRWGPRPLVIPGSFVVAAAMGGMYLLGPSTPLAQVVATHVVLGLGLGMVMTPLLTSSLGSLHQDLFSHGSAITNTLQQLAGAAGTALFISVMTATTANGGHIDTGSVTAQADGIHHAFLWGFVLTLIAAGMSFFLRSPRPTVMTTVVH
ncbi:multidrug efflux MFS transporter [Arthrobacter sp. BHU FT2]|nr:multidrug efflux MFS transporter [Arthrobacter sp. BHU FT2]